MAYWHYGGNEVACGMNNEFEEANVQQAEFVAGCFLSDIARIRKNLAQLSNLFIINVLLRI